MPHAKIFLAMRLLLRTKAQRGLRVRPDADELRGPSIRSTGRAQRIQTAECAQAKETPASPRFADTRDDTTHIYPSQPGSIWWELASAVYHWSTCLFITGLVLFQILGAVWDSRTTVEHLIYGRSPLLGPYQIIGSNDIPYSDRVIACVYNGNKYEPRLVSSLLASKGADAILEDSTGTAHHGYRLVNRREGSTLDALDSVADTSYRESCNLMAQTIDPILDACSALGYANLTRDNLRVLDGVDSQQLFRLPNALPVLIIPYWDNAEQARHAVPTWGGDACVFRLEDAFFGSAILGNDANEAMASFRGVNQTIRQEQTVEWLGRPGGVWKNGWYEDLEGERWYSDIVSSVHGAPYDMMYRLFDVRVGREVDCSDEENCLQAPKRSFWGPDFTTELLSRNVTSIAIANGTQFGFFLYESDQIRIVRGRYDWETLLSNASVGLVLMRWILIQILLDASFLRGQSQRFSSGIGCVSHTPSFEWLPLFMLPRLKMMLTAFWTVGCQFEGQQAGLSDSWFAVYPAIAQFVLMYFTLLNLSAKVLRRRVSDALFGPTVLALCLLHYFRLELAASGWLSGVDGRVPTLVFSDEVKTLKLTDHFTTDVSWRMNGGVTLLFATKLALLGINWLPLVMARSFPVVKSGVWDLHGVEKALGLRADHIGGLGRSRIYSNGSARASRTSTVTVAVIPIPITQSRRRSSSENGRGGVDPRNMASPFVSESTGTPPAPHRSVLLSNYELVQLGYLVFGDQYLIAFDDWHQIVTLAPIRSLNHLWNYRVLVWTLQQDRTSASLALLSTDPEMWRVDDSRLLDIHWWDVSACAIQC